MASTTSAVAAISRTTPAIGRQLAELKAGSDSSTLPEFGTSVAVSGATAIVGAPGHAGAGGLAFVFTETPTGWKQTGDLKGSDTVAGNEFGASIALSGTTAVVGAPSYGSDVGRAYVFIKTAKGWTQTAELKGSGIGTGASFGKSVATSGGSVVVGAPGHIDYAPGRATCSRRLPPAGRRLPY